MRTTTAKLTTSECFFIDFRWANILGLRITPEEYENRLMKVEHLLQEGASGLPFDDDMGSSALLECILRLILLTLMNT